MRTQLKIHGSVSAERRWFRAHRLSSSTRRYQSPPWRSSSIHLVKCVSCEKRQLPEYLLLGESVVVLVQLLASGTQQEPNLSALNL